MSDVSAPLPTTLAECHAQLQQFAADNAALKSVNTEQQATIDQQQATINEQQTTIDEQSCIACSTCVDICPRQAIHMVKK